MIVSFTPASLSLVIVFNLLQLHSPFHVFSLIESERERERDRGVSTFSKVLFVLLCVFFRSCSVFSVECYAILSVLSQGPQTWLHCGPSQVSFF